MNPEPRLRFVQMTAGAQPDALRDAVLDGLSRPQKWLPCRFFYDSRGSELFERICCLPEYYLTRSEQSILTAHAGEMIDAAGPNLELVEFGSGSSCKTRILMDAILARQDYLRYAPIDISADFLRASARTLLAEYDQLSITAIAAEYNEGMSSLPRNDESLLILFLGSNVGNFDRDEAVGFLSRIRGRMSGGDRILIGIDLVKDRDVLEAAYNDSAGTTEAFNKNLLLRINQEMGGRFEPDMFDHHAPYVDEHSRIEMRLISRANQTVPIASLDREFSFGRGEFIHTENSHKYTHESFESICSASGLAVQARWTDEREWFAVMRLRPVAR